MKIKDNKTRKIIFGELKEMTHHILKNDYDDIKCLDYDDLALDYTEEIIRKLKLDK